MKIAFLFPRTVVLTLGILTVLGQVDLVQAQKEKGRRGADRGGERGRDRDGKGGGGRRSFGGGSRGFGGSSLMSVVFQDSVRTELNITDEQIAKLEELSQSSSPDRSRLREMSSEERTKFFAENQKKSEEQLKTILKVGQYTRLQQLSLQRRGPSVLLQDEMATEFKITDTQKEKLEEAAQQRRDAFRNAFRDGLSEEERNRVSAEWNEKMLAVLAPEQKQLWDGKVGPPAGSAQKQPSSSTAAATTTTPQPQVTQPSSTSPKPKPSGSIQVNSDGSEIPKKVVISLAANTQAGSSNRSPAIRRTGRNNRVGITGGVGGNQMMSFTFEDAPWTDVLKTFAEFSELTLHLKSTPPGTFNYIDKGLYTPEEALDILNGYLLQEVHVMVRRDRFLVVINLSEPIPPNLIPKVAASELPFRGRNEILEVRFKLPEGVDAEATADEVDGMLGPQGSVVALASLSAISVIDVGSNLIQIDQMIQDQPDPPNKTLFKAFKLEFVSVYDAEKLVSAQLGVSQGVRNVSQSGPSSTSSRPSRSSFSFGNRGGSTRGGSSRGGGSDTASRIREMMAQRFGGGRTGGTGGDTSRRGRTSTGSTGSRATRTTTPAEPAVVTADTRTNTLFVSAPASKMKFVEEMIIAIDVPQPGDRDGRDFVTNTGEPFLRVYKVTQSDTQEVTKTLGVLIEGVVVNESARDRTIHVMATADQHTQVAKWIAQLDGDGDGGQQVAVLTLSRMDPLTAGAMINDLFINETSNPPTVTADPYTRRLLIRASASQVIQIKQVLLSYGETGTGSYVGTPGPRLPVRSISVGDRDPEKMLRMLQQMLQGTGQFENKIRIVIPSGNLIQEQVPSARGPLPLDRRQTPTNQERPARRREHPQREPVKKQPEQKAADNSKIETFVSFLQNENEKGEASSEKSASQSESKSKPYEEDSSAGKQAKPDITITIQGGNIVLTSGDLEALDRVEQLLDSLLQSIPQETSWKVFYLRTADAVETATMLSQLIPDAEAETSSSNSSNSNPFARFFGGGSTSRNRGGSQPPPRPTLSMASLQELKIIPDERSNALWVSGPREKVKDLENILKILDAAELPESLRDRAPRIIPVLYANVSEVAEIVKSVYQEEIGQGGSSSTPSRGGTGGSFFGRGGGGGRGGSSREVKLTVGVDTNTSQLIVSCNDSMYKQIQSLVDSLDESAYEAKRTVLIMTPINADASVISQAVTSLLPSVTVSTTSSSTSRSSSSGRSSSADADRANRLRQLFGGGGGGFNRGGGGFNRGGGGGPTRGGGGGGSNRGGGGGRRGGR
jgi:type II secretory pathway component GspD/PulD (secretin)